MNFREMAIQAHHKAEKETEARQEKTIARFAKRAVNTFYRSIANTPISVTPIGPELALLTIDGIEIEAREEHDAPEFYFEVMCPRCKEKSYVRTPTLADIGRALENGPNSCHCEAKRLTIQPGGWPEQMAEAFREAIYEMQS